MCGFIAQLGEQRTCIAEVTGSNPVEALIFFRLLLSNCLNWKINCDDHSSLRRLSVRSFVNPPVRSFVRSSTRSFVPLIALTARLSVCSFVRSPVRSFSSFVRSFLRPRVAWSVRSSKVKDCRSVTFTHLPRTVPSSCPKSIRAFPRPL